MKQTTENLDIKEKKLRLDLDDKSAFDYELESCILEMPEAYAALGSTPRQRIQNALKYNEDAIEGGRKHRYSLMTQKHGNTLDRKV